MDMTRIDKITATGPAAGTLTWTVNWKTLPIGEDGRRYICDELSGPCAMNFTHWVVESVKLPGVSGTAQAYTFEYSDDADDGYGEVDSIRTPHGAIYTYDYRLAGCANVTTGCELAEDILHNNGVTVRNLSGADVGNLQWAYTYDLVNFSTAVRNPDGGTLTYFYHDPTNIHDWKRGLVYLVKEPLGQVRKRAWAQNKVPGLSGTLSKNPNNPYIERESFTLGNALGQTATAGKTAVTAYTYDKNGNRLGWTEYDWVNYDSDPENVETGTTPLRIVEQAYHVLVPAATLTQIAGSDNANAYYRPHNSGLWTDTTGPRRLDAVRWHVIRDGSRTIIAASDFGYDNAYTSGNPTLEERWDSVRSLSQPTPGALSSSNALVLTRAYDTRGNLTEIYAPEIRTTIGYGSLPAVSGPGPYPTLVTYAPGTGSLRSSSYSWDYDTGLLRSTTDIQNGTATAYTHDVLGRRLTATEAGMRRMTSDYNDAGRIAIVKNDQATLGDGNLQSAIHYDPLGRVVLERTSDGATLNATGTDGIQVETSYGIKAGVGPWTVTSTPYRTKGDPTLEWVCTQQDHLQRVIRVSMFKGSSAPTDCGGDQSPPLNRTGTTRTDYDANETTITDPAGNTRTLKRGPLGRLVQVTEDPDGTLDADTTYAYDPLDNLKLVTQGAQTRTFVYSSLSRLVSATNPESGTIAYVYYDSGNLKMRTDARGVSTTFAYDDLQRILTKTYSDNTTPSVTYAYHTSGSPNVGQLQSISSSAAASSYTYDTLGRIVSRSQTIAGHPDTFTFTNTYFLNDAIQSQTYPSGRTVNYDVDDAGRVTKVAAGIRTYAGMTPIDGVVGHAYSPDGRLRQMKLGNNLWETREYHTPGTTTLFKLGTAAGTSERLELGYDYHDTANNGNLIGHTITRLGTGQTNWTQTFGYDALNRLKTAGETNGYSRTFNYDRYGNRWVYPNSGMTGGDSHEPVADVFDAKNQMTSLGPNPYDATGNQTMYSPYTLTYDAENRLASMTSTSSGFGTYLYNGEGRRVKKIWTPGGGAAQETYYVYDSAGNLAAEYGTGSTSTTATVYPFTDMLGSVRAVTDATGAVIECYDYLPFGRMLSSSDNLRPSCHPASPDTSLDSETSQKFTGQVRDEETRLDYFGVRYYSAAQGRFTSVDPALAVSLKDPQTWNRYAYVKNRPLNYVDHDGRWPTRIHNMLIQKAFPGLRDSTVRRLRLASLYADLRYMFHDEMHYTRSSETLGVTAKRNAVASIDRQIEKARQLQTSDVDELVQLNPDAVWEFGLALHTLMDSTSPAHLDEEGNPRLYVYDVLSWPPAKRILEHRSRESQITGQETDSTVDLMRMLLDSTFGMRAGELASRERTPQACVEVFDSASGSRSRSCD